MNFETWLLTRGLKQSTANSYASAIQNALSRFAKQSGFSDKSLDKITSAQEFSIICEKLKQLSGFADLNIRGHSRYSNALDRFAEYLSDEVTSDVESVLTNPQLAGTEKLNLVLCRVGQGIFRQRLIQHWSGRCAVTGHPQTSLLVASHIQPWRKSTNQERLNPFNGLLLVPNLDRAFDQGLVSFNPNGEIIIAPQLKLPKAMGIESNMRVKLEQGHLPFMEAHRCAFGFNDA